MPAKGSCGALGQSSLHHGCKGWQKASLSRGTLGRRSWQGGCTYSGCTLKHRALLCAALKPRGP
eukprot:scaffold204973_cov22-Tisochrysis_lutea.AAC.1